MKRYILFMAVILAGENCITLPPITLTGPKTAAEKQIIGEQNELEEDVWMVSSAKATSEVTLKVKRSEKETIQEETTLAEEAFAIFDVFSEELEQLKSDGVIGENQNGLLSNLLKVREVEIPQEIREKYSSATIATDEQKDREKEKPGRMLEETVKQINAARYKIAQSYILNQQRIDPEFRAEAADIIRSQRENYRNAAKKGEYIQLDDGTWERK